MCGWRGVVGGCVVWGGCGWGVCVGLWGGVGGGEVGGGGCGVGGGVLGVGC